MVPLNPNIDTIIRGFTNKYLTVFSFLFGDVSYFFATYATFACTIYLTFAYDHDRHQVENLSITLRLVPVS